MGKAIVVFRYEPFRFHFQWFSIRCVLDIYCRGVVRSGDCFSVFGMEINVLHRTPRLREFTFRGNGLEELEQDRIREDGPDPVASHLPTGELRVVF